MDKSITFVYAVITAICAYASYVNLTDDLSQPIISLALGLGLGTHAAIFIRGMLRK